MYYVQVVDGRIVGVSTNPIGLPNEIEMELPEDFDWLHIDRYEVTEDGELIKHDLPEPEPEPEPEPGNDHEERITALEEQLAEYEAAYTEGVQDA